jgi:hypothetical protein
LHDENGDCFGELGAGFHYAEAERNDFGRKEEVDDFAAVVLDESADNAEGGETKILEWARF